MAAFRMALRGLRAWAAAREVDSGAWGFMGGIGWAVAAARAAAEAEEDTPEAILERCFELLVAHDWAVPFTLTGEALPPDGDAPFQVLTPVAPRNNIARRSTAGTAAILTEALAGGLESVWRVRADKAAWTTLFTPVDARAHPAHVLLAVVSDPEDTGDCAGWLAGQAGTLLLRLEEASPIALRPYSRPLTRSTDGRARATWYLGLERRLWPTEADAVARVLESLVARFERWTDRPASATLTARVS